VSDDPVTRALVGAVLQAKAATEQITRTSSGLLRLAAQGPLRLVGESMKMANGVVVEGLRQALEIPELRQALAILEAQDRASGAVSAVLDRADVDVDDEDRLRRNFGELLDRSLQADGSDAPHPAFRRILAQLSPDEARILRLFHAKGPQAVMDVTQSNRSIGRSGTVLASNLTRIGDHAGCLDPSRGSLYLDNLERLGLVHVDDDELEHSDDYDLIAVGADFQAAARTAADRGHKGRGVRRAARLTALGARLLQIVLPSAEQP
jgi:hypothetical protein